MLSKKENIMTVTCELIETNNQNLPTYGLVFFVGGQQICTIEDMTLDRGQIEALRDAINRGGLEEIHIRDVVEDAVAMWA